MTEHKIGVEFESASDEERALWEQLGKLPQAEPSPHLRQHFYHRMDRMQRSTWFERLRENLGLQGFAGPITALTFLIVGLSLGQFLNLDGSQSQDSEFVALQEQVNVLHRDLILDRLESDSAGKRLRGVLDAAQLVEQDTTIARALLNLATEDRVQTVRSAAIDALAPQLNTPSFGDELMTLLASNPSPLVQLALVDLVLRHGSKAQIEQLVELSRTNRLDQALSDYVISAVGETRV